MPPSTPHKIDWDKELEPKDSHLHLEAIPNSTTMRPLEDKETRKHIDKIHEALSSHGYQLEQGDIINGYPLHYQ